MRDGDAVAEDLFRRVGDGNLFLTKFGRWFRGHKFNGSPDRFYVSYSDSIYFFKPSNQLTLSPTINVYGYEIGLDKLEHLLQQGWRYYSIRREAIDRGKPVADAERNAVDWGKRTERTYYGLMVSGVYSNGDLAANYAGILFYRSIFESISIDGESTKPIVRLDGGRWRIANDATTRILRPFITNHLNEALNPSMLAFNVYPTVARVVRDSACPQWRQRFDRDKATEFLSNSAAYRTWFGADYGHRSRGRSVSIDRCFNDQLPPNSTTTRSAS